MSKIFAAYQESFDLNEDQCKDFFECIDDLILLPEVQSLKEFEQHMDIDRLQHVFSVAYLSYLLCKKLGLDYRSAARGGILHDLFYYDWHENDLSHRLHGYRHPGFALTNARKIVVLNKKEENIIKRHMWPLTVTPPKYFESLIVSLSDKYCATRELIYCFSKKYDKKRTDLV